MELGPQNLIGRTPQFADGVTHVVDRNNEIWLLVHDGGMVTRADYTGQVWSAGTAWLEFDAGPLVGIDPKQLRANREDS
jgi:hypothetical protein